MARKITGGSTEHILYGLLAIIIVVVSFIFIGSILKAFLDGKGDWKVILQIIVLVIFYYSFFYIMRNKQDWYISRFGSQSST